MGRESVWGPAEPVAGLAKAYAAGVADEKKSLHALERDTAMNLQRRIEFLDHIRTIPAEKLIFLDESGVTTSMTRLDGRAPRGRRVHEATPGGHWKTLTILGAMNLGGMLAPMTVEAATDTDIFLAYLDQVLCPRLRPGDVVVMDNLSSHKVDGVRQRLQQRGAELLYLPPYSPDLNPIEKAWAKLKQRLRATKARSSETLNIAISNALPTITAHHATAWFRLCNYRVQLP